MKKGTEEQRAETMAGKHVDKQHTMSRCFHVVPVSSLYAGLKHR